MCLVKCNEITKIKISLVKEILSSPVSINLQVMVEPLAVGHYTSYSESGLRNEYVTVCVLQDMASGREWKLESLF